MMLNTSINHQPLWSQAGRTITTHKVFRSRQSGGLKVAGRSAGFRGVSSSVAELGTWRDDELVQSFVAGSPESEDQLILHENVGHYEHLPPSMHPAENWLHSPWMGDLREWARPSFAAAAAAAAAAVRPANVYGRGNPVKLAKRNSWYYAPYQDLASGQQTSSSWDHVPSLQDKCVCMCVYVCACCMQRTSRTILTKEALSTSLKVT
eukprot:1157666-Pelagomonas_calceolata.AAC.1